MNFLKISSLFVGTSSVVGGTSVGIYYVANVNKTNEEDVKNIDERQNIKTQFVGKLVFEKTSDNNYEIKFFDNDQYTNKLTSFDLDKSDDKKYEVVNKIIEISLMLNITEANTQLNDIFGEPLTLEAIKEKITEKESDIKKLFNDQIFEDLKSKFTV